VAAKGMPPRQQKSPLRQQKNHDPWLPKSQWLQTSILLSGSYKAQRSAISDS
jgi:hypothetical protein